MQAKQAELEEELERRQASYIRREEQLKAQIAGLSPEVAGSSRHEQQEQQHGSSRSSIQVEGRPEGLLRSPTQKSKPQATPNELKVQVSVWTVMQVLHCAELQVWLYITWS